MPPRLRVFAVLVVLAAAAAARADAPIQDGAHLFNASAVTQASEALQKIENQYRLDFFLQTVEKPPEDVQKMLKAAKTTAQKKNILDDWGAEEARKAGGDKVYILVCKDAVAGWLGTYGCVVVTVPPEARSATFTDADAQALHDRLRWFTRGNKAKNDAILLSSVAQVGDDLYYAHLPPFPWLGMGAVMAGALGLWGLLGLVRLRLRSASPPEARSPDLFAALLGGLFGSAAGHWIYDTLFVAASRSAAAPEPPAQAAPKETGPAEDVETPAPTPAERLDLTARDHPTEEPSTTGPARF